MDTPIFIPYETKNREFDGKLLLISHLSVDFKIFFFGSRKGVKREALQQKNGIYILKSVSVEEESFYQELKQRGHMIILLHSEGGIHYKDNRESLRSFFNEKLMKYVDINFLYGNEILDGIQTLFKQTGIRHVVTGEPRFDRVKPKYRAFFEDDVNTLRERYGKVLLVNTNFSSGNPFVGIEKLRTYWGADATLTQKAKELLFKKIELQKKLIQQYVSGLRDLADEFQSVNFIIRPHPSENQDFYINSFKDKQNIRINKEGNVVKWIIASKGIIHYDCTTGMEAALARRPVISYVPDMIEEITAWLPVELSRKCGTEKELKQEVNKVLNGSYDFSYLRKRYQTWKGFIHNLDIEASPIIRKELEKLSAEMPTAESRVSIGLIKDRLRTYLKTYYDKIRSRRSITREKFGVLDKAEINSKLNILSTTEQFGVRYRVRLKGDDVVMIMTGKS